jgi:16S rRNA C967 or C1407 C5-methylase (RsmB/RsmF family)/NOL1/NOP2/fmu family ribosome biogenesis protein
MANLPSDFQESIQTKLGDEFSAFQQSLVGELSPVSIRINPRKRNKITSADKVQWSDFGFYLPERPRFTFDPLFHAGTYYVQEASSMFLEQVFKQHVAGQGLNILDLSAAPGGKSTHILSLIDDQSLLVSNEVIRSRATILGENLLKWGYPNSIVTNSDPQDFARLPGFFDVIVVDAPCSGEGLFRKEPESMNEWSTENVNLCSSRQKRILADVWPALKENGILIYSTCTYNESENEDNLKWLKENHDIEFLSMTLNEQWGVVESSVQDVRGYRFYPHRVKGEGFFISAIRKKESTRENFKVKKTLTPVSKKVKEIVSNWVTSPDKFEFFQHLDYIFIFPQGKTNQLELVKNNLKFVQAGTTLAASKHDKIIPEHGSAMSIFLNQANFESVELELQQAIQYLRRETFEWIDQPKGFQLIKYQDIPLGWINSLGNRFNNLYPIDWRIRSAHQLPRD